MKSFSLRMVFGLLLVSALGAVALGMSGGTLAPTSIAKPAPAGAEAQFGDASLTLTFAITSAARRLGLGGRTSMATDTGMLFVFPVDGRYGFWMKDTLVPLDMFWLGDSGKVVFMKEDVLPDTYPTLFYPTVPARYVLETAAGFGAAHDIATGTPLVLPGGFPAGE